MEVHHGSCMDGNSLLSLASLTILSLMGRKWLITSSLESAPSP
ncbi:MAG: hypothetical protein ACE5QW_09340 [Thermoplasmata archaeon]